MEPKTVNRSLFSVGAIMAKKKRQAKRSSVFLIEREFPADQVPIYANHFVVQHDGPECYLMFFQIQPPVAVGKRKVTAKAKTTSVKAKCVTRIVMSADRIPDVIRAMQDNLAIAHSPNNPTEEEKQR